jgi:hypothetical protein
MRKQGNCNFVDFQALIEVHEIASRQFVNVDMDEPG